jgi:hypothetical protein
MGSGYGTRKSHQQGGSDCHDLGFFQIKIEARQPSALPFSPARADSDGDYNAIT